MALVSFKIYKFLSSFARKKIDAEDAKLRHLIKIFHEYETLKLLYPEGLPSGTNYWIVNGKTIYLLFLLI